VTEINTAFEGDAFAPELDAGWVEVAREPQVSNQGLRFDFVTYRRTACV